MSRVRAPSTCAAHATPPRLSVRVTVLARPSGANKREPVEVVDLSYIELGQERMLAQPQVRPGCLLACVTL